MLLARMRDSGLVTHCTITCGMFYTLGRRDVRYGWTSNEREVVDYWNGSIDKIPYWDINGSRFTLGAFYGGDAFLDTGAQMRLLSSSAKHVSFNQVLLYSDRWLTEPDGGLGEYVYIGGMDKYGNIVSEFTWDESANTTGQYKLYCPCEVSKDVESFFFGERASNSVQFRSSPHRLSLNQISPLFSG